MNTRIRNKLIQLSRTDPMPVSYRRLIVTTDLGLNMDIKHEKQLLGEILDEISETEHEAGRPLLSALVKNGKNGQDDRFYKMCERLGLGEWKELKKDKSFKKDHIDACHEFWSDEKNYKKFF
ncbi:hypothetical protein [Fulvivirga sedimenti]|uniref:Uncharacterized protein n=1 Tax=Fulvivirga sedimenti TaxID=2879465 RepID=A0A9X1HU44_9BACT|nr:hypothetical protein [Fulvivirga sedimenti]MCA6075421.1 hypothetical protein [Fulvivirga sedimenti]MCA6076598.1 hypothetical protein [Fulvivirga sedimenti]MCA6077726.1 hypothetical protein [Fulvivirga sedimenti]